MDRPNFVQQIKFSAHRLFQSLMIPYDQILTGTDTADKSAGQRNPVLNLHFHFGGDLCDLARLGHLRQLFHVVERCDRYRRTCPVKITCDLFVMSIIDKIKQINVLVFTGCAVHENRIHAIAEGNVQSFRRDLRNGMSVQAFRKIRSDQFGSRHDLLFKTRIAPDQVAAFSGNSQRQRELLGGVPLRPCQIFSCSGYGTAYVAAEGHSARNNRRHGGSNAYRLNDQYRRIFYSAEKIILHGQKSHQKQQQDRDG